MHRQSFNVIGSANRHGHSLYFNVNTDLFWTDYTMIHIRLIGSGSDTHRLVHEEAEFSYSYSYVSECILFDLLHSIQEKETVLKRLSSEVLARSSTAPGQPSLQVPSAVCWFSFTPTSSSSSAPGAWGRPLPALLKHLENSHDMRELIWRRVPLSTLPAQLTFCGKGRQVRSVHRRTKCWWRRRSWRWCDLEIRAAACQENAGRRIRNATHENGDVVFGCAVTCWALRSVFLVAVPLIFCSRRKQEKKVLH